MAEGRETSSSTARVRSGCASGVSPDLRDRSPGRRAAILALMVSIAGFSSVPVFIKHFSSVLDPWTVNGVRYGVAALALLPWVIVLHGRFASASGVWRAALLPAGTNLAGQVLWAWTPYFNSASVNGFVIRSSFFFTLLVSLFLLPGERRLARSRLFWVGSLVCVVGMAAMFGASLRREGHCTPVGVALLLVTAGFWGLYLVSVRTCLADYPVRLAFGVVSLYTAAGLVLLLALFGAPSSLAAVSVGNRCLLVVSGLIGIAMSHVLMFKAIHGFGPVLTSGANLVVPFLTAVSSAAVLGERMGTVQWAGGATLVAGTLVLVAAQARLG